MKQKIISGNDPVKFYQDCKNFEKEQPEGNILEKYPVHLGFPMQAQAVNIPGFKAPVQNITIQMYFSMTYILKELKQELAA